MPGILYILLLGLSLIWGGSFFFIKVLLGTFDPWTVTFLRCLFGVLTLFVIGFWIKERLNWRAVPWFKLVIIGILNSALPWTLIAFSETRISSVLASVLNASTPLWTLLVGVILFRLGAHAFQWIGVGIGFMGIVVLTDFRFSTFEMESPIAVLAMIGVGICYALSFQMTKRFLTGMSPFWISATTLTVGGLFTGLMALSMEDISWGAFADGEVLLSLVGLGVLGTGIAYLIFYRIIQQGSAELASMVTYLVPPFSFIWGSVFLGESIGSRLVFGMLLILLGVYVSSRRRKDRLPVKKTANQ
jgi:drug/metabolite transporter (DMT)-like permease